MPGHVNDGAAWRERQNINIMSDDGSLNLARAGTTKRSTTLVALRCGYTTTWVQMAYDFMACARQLPMVKHWYH